MANDKNLPPAMVQIRGDSPQKQSIGSRIDHAIAEKLLSPKVSSRVANFISARVADPKKPDQVKTIHDAVESGFQEARDRLHDPNSHTVTGDNKTGIKEDAQYPNVFYRHSHEKIGAPSNYSVSFLVRAPNLKDAQDPFGHEYVILNHPDTNGKPTQTILSYVAESFDKGKISKAWSVLAHGAPDNHVNGKLATHRDAKGNIVNPQDAADQVITVNLQDGNGITASQKMDKLVGLANDIEKKSYELYDYNCDASVLEMLKGVSVLSPNIAAEANTKVNAARNGQFHMLLDGNALQKTGNSINPNYTDLPKDFTVNVPPAFAPPKPAPALPHH